MCPRITHARRINCTIPARAATALDEALHDSGDNITGVITSALQVYAYLQRVQADGGVILVAERVGEEPKQLRIFI